MEKEYIDTFENRLSQVMLEKYCADYIPEALENNIHIISELTYKHIFTE